MNLWGEFFWKRIVDGSPLRDPESEPLIPESERSKKPARQWDDTDGVLSWLVALGIFLVNFVVLGQGRVAGILYMRFMKDFGVNRKMASAPYSVQQSTRMLFGSVVGIISSRFSVSLVIVLGCILTALSSASCYFAEDIEWIIIMWGGIYGIGTAFTSSINVALIEQYFTKYRSSASGLAFSGTCVGSILFPALMEIMVKKYGIQGSFLIMGAIILNAIPVAMLLRERRRKTVFDTTFQANSSKSNSRSNYEESLENGAICPSGSKIEGHLRTPYANLSFADSGVLHLPTNEIKKRISFDSFSREEGTFRASAFCDSQKDYSEEKPHGIFADTLKCRNDSHKEEDFLVQNDEDIASIILKTTKTAENSNQDEPKHDDVGASQRSSDIFPTPLSAKNSGYKQKSPQDSIVSNSVANYGTEINPQESVSGNCFSLGNDLNTEDNNAIGGIPKQFDKISSSCKDLNCDKQLVLRRCQPQSNFGNVINFRILHENRDLVLSLLANKIPIGNEEIFPFSCEITQNDLESPDVEFISVELQRIEYLLQQPPEEVQRSLNGIREKLKQLKNVLDSDRNKYLIQNKLDLERRKLKYKEIRSMTIRKSEYAIEVFEYSCEIPTELYIPMKLEELCERSSAHIMSYYSGNKRIAKILKQLKRLHEILSGNPVSKGHSFDSKTLSEVISCSDDMKLIERRKIFTSNPIVIALKMHTNPLFLLICLTRGLTALTFVPVFTSVVDFAVDKGMAESNGVYAIAALSVGDLIGRVCTGWITDKGYINDVSYMVMALILQGTFTAVLPQARGEAKLLPLLLVFAIFQGSLFVRHPLTLLKYLQEHEKQIGLGFINLFSGILGFLTPYYIGYFRDYLGSYDIMYYINGGLSAFVGLLWIFEPCLKRFAPAMSEMEDICSSNENSIM